MHAIEHLTLAQVARVLGRSRMWAYKTAKRGQLGPVIFVPPSPVRRVYVSELEARFGPIGSRKLERAVLKGV
jgi:hypothetical protein